MYIRFTSLLPIAALAAVVAAAPGAIEARSTSQCNTGTLQCCNSVESTSSTAFVQYVDSLGLGGFLPFIQSIPGQAGINCSPITVAGTGSGATCVQEPVCCNNNTFSGLIVIGCSPITSIA